MIIQTVPHRGITPNMILKGSYPNTLAQGVLLVIKLSCSKNRFCLDT